MNVSTAIKVLAVLAASVLLSTAARADPVSTSIGLTALIESVFAAGGIAITAGAATAIGGLITTLNTKRGQDDRNKCNPAD